MVIWYHHEKKKKKVRPELPDAFSVERPLVFMMKFHLQESLLDSRREYTLLNYPFSLKNQDYPLATNNIHTQITWGFCSPLELMKYKHYNHKSI